MRGGAEAQALLHDHTECGKHTAADIVVKAQSVLSEPELLRGIFDVGYFLPNTPPMSDRARHYTPITDSKVDERRGRKGAFVTFWALWPAPDAVRRAAWSEHVARGQLQSLVTKPSLVLTSADDVRFIIVHVTM